MTDTAIFLMAGAAFVALVLVALIIEVARHLAAEIRRPRLPASGPLGPPVRRFMVPAKCGPISADAFAELLEG